MKQFLLLLAVSLCLSCRLFAQSNPLEYYGIEQGLSQGFVTCLLQDQEGFMWAGTLNGLNRFDGHRFKAFSNDPFDSLSVSGDFITAIYEKGDYLLVGTLGNGLNIFHKKTQRFFRVPHLLAAQSPVPAAKAAQGNRYPAENVVNNIVQDARGDIWMKASNAGHDYQGWAVRMKVPEGFWEKLPENPALLYQLQFDAWWLDKWELYPFWPSKIVAHGDELYSFQLGGLLSFDAEKKQWAAAQQYKVAAGVVSNIVWSKAGAGCLVQSPDFQTYHCTKPGDCAPVGKVGGLVIAWDDKLVLTREGGQLVAHRFDLSPSFRMTGQPVFQLPINDTRTVTCFDRSGNLWYTEGTAGLVKYSPSHGQFQHYFNGQSIMTKPFMSRKGGLYHFSEVWEQSFDGPTDPVLRMLATLYKNDTLMSFNINDDGNGHYWLAAYRGMPKQVYLVRLNVEDGRYVYFRVPRVSGVAFCAEYDEKGKLWFPVNGVLVSYDTSLPGALDDAGRWGFYDYGAATKIPAPVMDLEQTPDGSWWMATHTGLIRAKPSEGGAGYGFSIYKTDPFDRHSLHSSHVSCLLADPKDPALLWVGTKGGLGRMDIQTGSVKTISTQQGLPDKVIYGILSDHNILPKGENYSLWMSSNRGLIRYTPATGQIKNFRKADGLQDDEFNSHAFAYTDGRRKAGRLMFGGVNGLNVFDPNDLADNPLKPRVFITGIKVNDQPVSVRDSASLLSESIDFTEKITLPFSRNSVSFDFAALEFTAPSKNRYRYWMEGFEKENAHETDEPHANYIGLSPGKYTLIVYGSNNDGLWCDEPARLEIRILPPWYRTWWAQSFYLLVAAGLIAWYLYARREQRELQFALEKKQYELAMQQQETKHVEAMHRLKLEEFAQRLLEKTRLVEELNKQQGNDENGDDLSEEALGHKTKEHILNASLFTKEDWSSFQKLFDEVYPGFQQELLRQLPAISPAETRLLLLRKLGLTRPEIASMLGVSIEAVKKTRQRLQRKLTEQGLSLLDLMGEGPEAND